MRDHPALQPDGPVAERHELAPEPFEFTGAGGEYFRIWIVNLTLTILTLGIYSAWAKVRRLQYFSRHTRVAGSVFDYHGSPVSILVGRIIALVLFTAWNLASSVPGPLMLGAAIMLGAVLPLLLRNSFRFRAHNTSYRGLRFSFRGSVAGAYITFLVFGLLTLGTFSLLAPMFHQRMKAYQHGNAWFGRTPFRFDATVPAFYGVYLLVGLAFVGIVVATLLAFGGFAAGLMAVGGEGGKPSPAAVTAMAGIGILVFLAVSLVIGPLFNSRVGNLVWNHTRLGEHRFESRLKFWPLFVITFTNFLLVVVTLGLYMPWAAVRVARYRAQSMTLIPATPLDEFLADVSIDVSATGEETAEMFDFDIGL